jgi:hypothetical protein
MKSSAEKIAMESYEDIFKPTDQEGQRVITNALQLDQLHPFEHHPYLNSKHGKRCYMRRLRVS